MTIGPLDLDETIVNNCLVLLYIEKLHENDDYLQQIGINHFFSKQTPSESHNAETRAMQRVSSKQILQLELGPLLLHSTLPLPFLPANFMNPLVDTTELKRKPRPKFLQTSTDTLCALHFLAVRPNDGFLRLALLTEDVPMSAHEEIVTLVVDGNYISALEVWL